MYAYIIEKFKVDNHINHFIHLSYWVCVCMYVAMVCQEQSAPPLICSLQSLFCFSF